jgi:hypothetical protein
LNDEAFGPKKTLIYWPRGRPTANADIGAYISFSLFSGPIGDPMVVSNTSLPFSTSDTSFLLEVTTAMQFGGFYHLVVTAELFRVVRTNPIGFGSWITLSVPKPDSRRLFDISNRSQDHLNFFTVDSNLSLPWDSAINP